MQVFVEFKKMIPPEQVLQNLMVSVHPLPENSPSGRVLPSLPYRLGQSRVGTRLKCR
jgi:hypothetical protein